ncbi:MAG: hypothetical protein KDD66_18490 [Bdellovibrionales bacterium]|nr:hypothetical protein [Bdellovibrionales bacterium]
MQLGICHRSGEKFEITEWEREFLSRISPEFDGTRFSIPLPRLSPKERARLRAQHRNEQYLYRHKSTFSAKPLVSIYPNDTRSPLISRTEWFSDSWDGLQYGREFDFSRPFFEQIFELQAVVPRAATVTLNNENCDYTTGTAYCKNCYMINSSENCQDCLYSKLLQQCSDVVDSAYCYDSELLYHCFNVRNCYNCKWVYDSQHASDCWFCDDLRNCENCFLCTNLVGKSYCFFNEQLEKEEYVKRVKAFTETYSKLNEARKCFEDLRAGRWFKYPEIINCESCTGDFLRNSNNCSLCYDMVDSVNCMHVYVGVRCSDMLDCSNMYLDAQSSYQVLGTIGTNNVHFCLYVMHSANLWYCEQCTGCQDCFGCIGLKGKQYCIFNKQYDKDKYEPMVRRIIEHMQQGNEWGEFFPAWMSPFPYNKSLAQEYFPLGKEDALQLGCKWEDAKAKDYQEAEEVAPERISETKDSICGKLLACSKTGKNYRIQVPELKFHRKIGLPLSQLCPEERYQRLISIRRPRGVWDRECDECGEQLKSVFPPDSDEKVLCERHYQEKVS